MVPALTVIMLLALAGTGCTARMKESYHQKRGDRYYDAGQYDQADLEYKSVLRNNPRNAQAWSRLGFIYFDEGRLGQALQFLRQAQQFNTNNPEVYLKLSAIYLQAGQLQNARDAAGHAFEKAPGNPQAPILLAEVVATNQLAETRLRLEKMPPPGGSAPLEVALGVLALRQSDLKTAEADFRQAASLDPKFAETYSALGNLYVAKNDLKAAEQAFKTAAELAPPRSGKALQYAQFEILSGVTAAGKAELEGLVKKAPDYLPAWMALAELAGAEKKADDGIALLGNVLNRDPQNLEGLLLKGRLELQAGETDKAATDFENLAKFYPKMPVVQYQLAQAHLANHETDKAVANLTQALNLNPQYADAIQSLAEIQIRAGNPAPAIEALQKLTRQLPRLVSVRLLLADAYRVQGRLDNAVPIYRELLKEAPKNAQYHLLLGATLLQQTNLPEARLELELALKLAPDFLPALEQVVNLDVREKQYTAAQQRVQEQIGNNPKSAELQLLLANVLGARGDTNGAEATLQHAIELAPDAQQPYMMLAQLHAAAHQYPKVIADLRAALAKNAKDTGAWLFLGLTCEAQKDYQAAADAYEKLLALTPNYGVALNNLACLYADHLGQLDKGYQLAVKARDLAPADPSIADTLGWIQYRKGQYFPALTLLRESAAKFTAQPEIQYHLGMTYYMLGDEANARTVLQHALQVGGDFPEKNDCNQSLAVLAIDPATAGPDQRAWLEKWVAGQPKDAVALMRLAAIYQREGAMDKALATYQAVLQATPQNALAMVNLARLDAPRDLQKAFSLAKAAYNLTPNDPLVTHTLGRLAFQTGDFQWALSLLQLTAQNQPQNAEVLYDLAESFYSFGRVREAQTALQTALQTGAAFTRTNEARRFLTMLDLADQPAQALAAQAQVGEILKSAPQYVPALMVKALLAENKPDPAVAEATYEEVLTQYPDFVPALKKLASLYAQTPATNDKAYALAVKARKALPADAEVARTLGIVVFRRGDFSQAASLLLESARQRSEDAELRYYLGMAQYRLKNRTESKVSLQRALDLKLSGPEAAEARQVLAELK